MRRTGWKLSSIIYQILLQPKIVRGIYLNAEETLCIAIVGDGVEAKHLHIVVAECLQHLGEEACPFGPEDLEVVLTRP